MAGEWTNKREIYRDETFYVIEGDFMGAPELGIGYDNFPKFGNAPLVVPEPFAAAIRLVVQLKGKC